MLNSIIFNYLKNINHKYTFKTIIFIHFVKQSIIILLSFLILGAFNASAIENSIESLDLNISAQKPKDSHNHDHVGLHHWEIPSNDPDRIILTFNGDPSSKRAVTWRTDSSVKKSVAQIALAGVNSSFSKNAKTYTASTEKFDVGLYKSNNSYMVNYHSVTFEKLEPNSL